MIKKQNRFISALTIGCMIAFVFLAIQREWIIIQLPSWAQSQAQQTPHTHVKQSVTLFWYRDRWTTEPVEIITSQTNPGYTIKSLIDRWLTWLDEERLTEYKISLQSALVTPDGATVMLSFDRSPFGSENSTHQKLSWVESLLKTIRDNGVKIQQVKLLVHHQELQDYHLDFRNPWPTIGFWGERA